MASKLNNFIILGKRCLKGSNLNNMEILSKSILKKLDFIELKMLGKYCLKKLDFIDLNLLGKFCPKTLNYFYLKFSDQFFLKNKTKKYFVLFLLCLAIGACTTKPVKKKTKYAKKSTIQKSAQPQRGFVIEGKDKDNAIANLFDQIIDMTEEETQVINDGTTPPYYNRLLKAVVDEKATVGQVNQALKKVGVLLSFSEEKSPQVTILIPPPGGLQNLLKYESQLEKSKVFESVGIELPDDVAEPIATPEAPPAK